MPNYPMEEYLDYHQNTTCCEVWMQAVVHYFSSFRFNESTSARLQHGESAITRGDAEALIKGCLFGRFGQRLKSLFQSIASPQNFWTLFVQAGIHQHCDPNNEVFAAMEDSAGC
jgi:hypothetical protein